MSSILGKDEGIFDPSKRFAFTNITDNDFVSAWGGSPITVKAGETIELPHHLANKLTDELVDQIMIGEAKLNEVKYYEEHPGTRINDYRAPSSLGVPQARKVWEDKIVRQLEVDEESPNLQIERARIREELMADLKAETKSEPVKVPHSLEEFSELGQGGETKKEEPKAPLKVKKIK